MTIPTSSVIAIASAKNGSAAHASEAEIAFVLVILRPAAVSDIGAVELGPEAKWGPRRGACIA